MSIGSHGRAGLLGTCLFLGACNQAAGPAEPAQDAAALTQLAAVPTNDIEKTPELLQVAMSGGESLYATHCASCHGADLKGVAAQHTPDLTDNDWIYAGDDLDTGGIVHNAADIEKTILYGIRAVPRATDRPSQRENDAANLQYKNLADMPAMGAEPYNLTDAEMADVTEYVLQLSGQAHDAPIAARGKAVFDDKGSCYDCHGGDGSGDMALGSTNLTKPGLYLYGSGRTAILASIRDGRKTVMPGFEGRLKPEEVKAIAVYTLSQGGRGAFTPPPQ